MTNTTNQNKTNTSNPDNNIVTAKSDIASLLVSPKDITLRIVNAKVIADITCNSFEKIEDHINAYAGDLTADQDQFDQAVNLLNENGFEHLSEILCQLVQGKTALDWLSEHYDDL